MINSSLQPNLKVSIHAPVQGATKEIKSDPAEARVSIHAPVQGATPQFWTCRLYRHCFYPRPSAGGDDQPVDKLHDPDRVSIHAPVQGATPGTITL